MADEDKAVLASRVLSFLKRSIGHGPRPTESEAKAAMTALTLLSTAFPAEAKDPTKMFEKLKEFARVNRGAFDNIDAKAETEMLRIQMAKRSQMFDMLSNIMKTKHETVKNTLNNIR